ncbi:MAG: Gfo/Idh/MocA family protein [bacterium]|jgi:predicted dehydrogenase
MKKIRWGVISTAKIGVVKVIPAMQKGEFSEVTAIASRNPETARTAAQQLSIPKYYASYEELLADPDIDAIYNPLPNHLHVPWSIKALEAGKHVLCEKPIGLSSDEGLQLIAAARAHPHLKVMEAFMYRHHPQWQKAKALVKEGGIGTLGAIQSFFSYYNTDPDNIRNMADIGGGGLMDIGCYNISLSRFIFDAEPVRVCGLIDFDPRFKTDRMATGIMEFEQGTSSFVCSTQLVGHQRVNLVGTEGRVEIEIPFNAPPDRPCRIWHQQGQEVREILLEVCDQYTIQGDLFSRAILDDTEVPTPIEDSVQNMKVIEAFFRSAQQNGWVQLDSSRGK